MEAGKVDRWLRENAERIGIDYKDIHSTADGESNHNFIVEADDRMVLRISRSISRRTRLENEAKKLDFLESQSIDSVPRKIHLEKDAEIGEVLLETYVGDKDVNKDNLNEERLRSFAEKIAEIHSIPVKSYQNFSGKSIEETTLKDSFEKDFRKWSKRPYHEYLELADNPDERIERFFRKQKELLSNVPEQQIEQSLTHGDLGFNFRASGNQVSIIDWEFSRIDVPENEILYFFEHGDLDSEQREVFLNEYRKHRSPDENFELLREIYPKFLAFNDMIWAAKRVEEGDDKQELFEERMERLENYYS